MSKFMLRRIGMSDDPTALKPTLHDCIETVLAQSDALMGDVLQGLGSLIVQPKHKAPMARHHTVSQAVLEPLLLQAKAMQDTFGVQLRVAIYQGSVDDPALQPLVRFDDLQLLDEQQIDANIEFAMAQQELNLAVEEVLPALNALISSLMGWMSVQAHLNPLRPEVFARALRETLGQLVPHEPTRNALMTWAAGYLGVGLRQLYRELTDWLRSQGVEPVIPMGPAASADQRAQEKTQQSSVGRTLLTLDKLRRLLSGELDGGMQEEPQDFLHTIPASMVALEDLKLVEPMMRRLSQRAGQAKKPVPVHAAKRGSEAAPLIQEQVREPTVSQKLGQQLGEEVVRLMLEHLASDQRMLPRVRQQLGLLEPLLVRLAHGDPRFFSDKRHPARQLLDRLTHRSLGFAAESDPGFMEFFTSMSAAIEALNRGKAEAPAMAQVLQYLERQWEQADAEQRQRQEEAARALVHAEQRNMLAKRLSQDFQERLRDKGLPELVVAFLSGPWAQVVAESQLKYAEGGKDAEGYAELVDDLIWSVQWKLTRRNRRRLVKLVPPMLIRLRQGLQLIDYPPEYIPLLFDELITYHEKAFEGPRTARGKNADTQGATESTGDATRDSEFSESVISILGLEDAPDAEALWFGRDEAHEAGYLTEGQAGVVKVEPTDISRISWTAHDLALGTWVELSLQGKWVRAELTWASPHRSLFMFVSCQGLAHSMSRRTMERLRNQGLIRIVSDGRVVDNALDAVAQAALLNDRPDPSG